MRRCIHVHMETTTDRCLEKTTATCLHLAVDTPGGERRNVCQEGGGPKTSMGEERQTQTLEQRHSICLCSFNLYEASRCTAFAWLSTSMHTPCRDGLCACIQTRLSVYIHIYLARSVYVSVYLSFSLYVPSYLSTYVPDLQSRWFVLPCLQRRRRLGKGLTHTRARCTKQKLPAYF